MKNIEIYTKEDCTYCERAKLLLSQKNLTYKEIFVDKDPKALEAMLSRAEGRRSVPQIFIDGRGIGGYDDLFALIQAEKLGA